MTRDDITRMAREACGDEQDPFVSEWITFDYAELERFAALVAAAERETFYGQDKPNACRNGCPIGQICDYCQIIAPVQKMISEAVAVEREACAKVCDDHVDGTPEWNSAAINCADAIRARGQA